MRVRELNFRMRLRFGLFYLAFAFVGIVYELIAHSFSVNAIVNYVLEGFLFATGIFIVFYIAARIVISAYGRLSHTREE